VTFLQLHPQTPRPNACIFQDGASWQAFVDYNLLWLAQGTSSASAARRQLEQDPNPTQTVQVQTQPGGDRAERKLFNDGGAHAAEYAVAHRYLRKGKGSFFSWFRGSADVSDVDEDVGGEAMGATQGSASARDDSLQNARSLQSAGAIGNLTSLPTFTYDLSADPSGFAPLLLMSDIIVGGIRIRRTTVGIGACTSAPQLTNPPATCRSPETFSSPFSYIQNPSASINLVSRESVMSGSA
jgi:hypothetical protein